MTLVNAPIERCFQLSLSIDLLALAAREKAIGGVTRGLIGPGQTVTWSGPFGRKHQSQMEEWRPYLYFREVSLSGPFRNYSHDHHFAPMNDGTRIRDEINCVASWGPLGYIAERLYLRRSIARYLKHRNELIKSIAESEQWHQYLDGQPAIDMQIYRTVGATASLRHREYAG